jgi:peptidoglycan/xylan/chitin deacetylase (PgdA/CDA1 family)
MTKAFTKSPIFFICIILRCFSLCACSNEAQKDDGNSGAPDTEEKEAQAEGNATEPQQTTASPEESELPTAADESFKRVAFTFDDGPHNELTKKIIDTLAEYEAHATFFVVGNRINEKTAEVLKYAASNGNEIGMHSFTHTQMFDECDNTTYEREVKYTKNNLVSYVGVTPTLLRPPGGLMSAERVSASQYPIIMWSVDSEDWKHKKATSEAEITQNVQTIVDNVLSNIDDGDIVLMHDIYENTYQAFSILINALYDEGFRLVTVSELLGDSIKSGAKFHSVTLQ